ncbi:unnamed protein product [Cuscuta epithymum]|uniref:CCHC-type domain-containing protein n=1 Tax=Cuscuta epithymum TaxID=186058 RepID=A0AAV0FGM5_9ASTE|nr:unnamed protein product [Cuscuta epithymum]
MGKRERKLKACSSSSPPEGESKESEHAAATAVSDDDAEGNEDLSLKIVETAIKRAKSLKNDADLEEPMSVDSKKSKKEKKKKKRKDGDTKLEEKNASHEMSHKCENFCSNIVGEDKVNEGDNENTTHTIDNVKKDEETNPAEIPDNAVLRKLLRGPRYFDPPGSGGWGSCYNCGEEGHMSVNCTAARRKKPCFLCGSLEHNIKQCKKGKDCFICKKEGHRAKDCPEKNNGGSWSSKMCLKCGDSGHDMFSCHSDYHPDDLKLIQCYICKRFGHLCCADYPDNGPSKVSCYKCGSLGHTGLACAGFRGESSATGTLLTCYRCGEDGHFSRECTFHRGGNKRSHDLSTPKKKIFSNMKEECMGSWSMPIDDFGKRRKKKEIYEGDFRSEHKIKRRGGWIMDDPEDFSGYKNSWTSHATPSSKRSWKYSNGNSNGHASNPWSSRKSHAPNFTHSPSSVSSKHGHHRFSASRFGDSSHGGRRNSDW